MKVGLVTDNTMPLYIPAIVNFFSDHSTTIQFEKFPISFEFNLDTIDYENERSNLDEDFLEKTNEYDSVILVTAKAFNNNFFYEGRDGVTIISFNGWHHCTKLPISNGLIYIICQILVKYELKIGGNHEENKGCINDFWWDKTGIDVGMRAAFLCEDCRKRGRKVIVENSGEFSDLETILEIISKASRLSSDVLLIHENNRKSKVDQIVGTTTPKVFLCHNSEDKSIVRVLNSEIKAGGIKTWFDEDDLSPGSLWQDELEQVIEQIESCLIIVADSGTGPWQDAEMRAFLAEFVNRSCKIIPVLIGCPKSTPKLPLFLRQLMWVDLRNDYPKQLARLLSVLNKS